MVRSCGNTSTSKHEEIRHNYENGGVSRCLGKSGCPRAAGDQRGEGCTAGKSPILCGPNAFLPLWSFLFLAFACMSGSKGLPKLRTLHSEADGSANLLSCGRRVRVVRGERARRAMISFVDEA